MKKNQRIVQKTKIRNSMRKNMKKGTAMLLLLTMLPFSNFAQMGTVQVNAAGVSANMIEAADTKSDTIEEIHTHGGEDIDAFVNEAVHGQLPENPEDAVIGEDRALTGDMVVMNLKLEEGNFDLQGHTLFVCGSFIQSGGVFNVNGGRVVILGDYRIQSVVETNEAENSTEGNRAEADGTAAGNTEDNEYTTSKGCLCLNHENDYLLVMGDFYTDSEADHYGKLDQGIMEVKGDFTQYATAETTNFCSDGSFRLYLTGTEEQKLEMADRLDPRDHIANLVIENDSEQGVTLINRPYVTNSITTGESIVNGCIGIGGNTVFTEDYFDGGISVRAGGRIAKDLIIGEDLVLDNKGGALTLTAQLEIKGNARVGYVIDPTGGSLIVDGDMTVSDNGEGYSSGLFMNDDSVSILVRGNYTQKTSGQLPMVKGILEVQGNMTVDGTFAPSGSQKVILSGEHAQYVKADNGASFHILELQNHSEAGVIMGDHVTWKKLIHNGCHVTMGGNSGYVGYTLEEDEVIRGEYVLTGGSLDLNGHTMTIKGNLIQSAGTIILNGGSLIIEGDYRRQIRIKDENGNVSYEAATASLKMRNANDHLLVKGNFYDSASADSMDEISAGCLELKGDLYQSDDGSFYHWRYPQGHLLLISGTEKQTLHFNNGNGQKPELYDLKITNTSEEGVVIEGAPWVDGKCESSRDSHIEGLVYKASYDSEWGDYYGGDLGILDCLNLKNNFELGGSLYLQDRLNVYADLTVDGNIYMSDDTRWRCNGYIYLSEGNLVVKGDVEAQSDYYYSGIMLKTDNAYALIEGDYRINGMNDSFELYSNAGVLEVKGDVDLKGEFVHRGRLLLSGSEKQTVRVGENTEIDEIEVIGDTGEGVDLYSFVYAKSWNTEGRPVTYRGEKCIFGDSLTENTIIDGSVVLLGGELALNGYKLQINGDFIQMAGDVRVSKGELQIKGDYLLGIPDDELPGYNTKTFGMLYMTYGEDHVCVEGNFSVNKEKGYEIGLHAGVLEVWGNVDYNYALYSTGGHVLLLNGDKKQTVTFHRSDSERGKGLKNLTLDNQSEEGIVFVGHPYFAGTIADREENHVSGAIAISFMSQLENGYFGGSIDYSNSSLGTEEAVHIGGNLLFTSSVPLTLSSRLKIDGDLDLNGIVKMNQGELLVGGNLTIEPNGSSYMINGINMGNDADYVLVMGDFINHASKVQQMEAGILEVKGDYQEDFGITYGKDHKIIFSGEAGQTIQQNGRFHILELQNTGVEGIFSDQALKYDELITNGCKLVIGDENSVTGFTLEDDYIMAGDLYLVDGILDLSGHTLVVQGDLILQEGTIKVSHGKLIVEGDFRQQKRRTTEKGYEYSQSAGYLYMDYEDDLMQVAGDCIFMAPYGNGSHMKGTVEIGGDLDSRGSCAFRNDGNLILNGTEKQTILSDYDIELGSLKIENQSAEGICMEADMIVRKTVSDMEMKAGGKGTVKVADLNCLEEGRFGGNVTLSQKCTIQKDIEIKGCLTLRYDKQTGSDDGTRCGDHIIHAGALTVGEALYIEKGQIYVDNDLLTENRGALLMEDSDGYLLVNGNAGFTGNGKSVWTAGTIELNGDLVQTGANPNFTASDEHHTILSGSRNDKGEDLIQRIHLDAPDCNRFHTLVLKKDLYTCYEFDTIPEDIADEVIYELATTLYPRPVTRITADQITPFSVTIGFDGKWSEGETAGFAVYRDGILVGTTGTKSYKDTGLEPGKTYTYTVLPYNGDKNYAKESPEFLVQTDCDGQPPEKVCNLRVSMRTGSAVTLTWDRGKDNVGVTGYRLYRDGKLIYEGSALQYEDRGLENKTVYQYQIEAVDGSGNISEKCDVVDGVVFMPRILSVEPADYGVIGGNTAKLQVTFSGEGKSRGNAVKIEYYDQDYREWKPITKTLIGQKEESGAVLSADYVWHMENLELGREVDIRYTVRDKDGSETEKIVTYTVDREAPPAPENVHASDQGGTVIIDWEKSGSADCAGYKIYRVQPETGEGGCIADVEGKNTTWYEDVNVEDGKTYQYYLRAYDNFDQLGSMSNVAKVTVLSDDMAPRMVSMTPDPGRVGGVTTLTLEGKDNRQVTGFELYIKKDGEETWEPLSQIPAKENKGIYLWNTALYEDGTYYVKAAAMDQAGNKSEALFMRRYEVDHTGIAKIVLAQCDAGSTAVQLTWEDVTEEDFAYFRVEELKDGKWQCVGKVTDTLGIRIEKLCPGTSHTYRVLGVDKLENYGIPSDEITLTTTEDTVSPVISAILPISSYYGEKIPLSMTVEDQGGVAYGVFSYSENGEDYIELARVNAGGGEKETIRYVWDTSALPEEDIYVRFEAYDNAGNHNFLYEEKEIENLYKIDHTAPGKVTGLSVTGEEGAIDLKWGQVSENDIAGYQVYRAKEGTNRFICIEEKAASYGYHDRNVQENVTYIYQIAAVDLAGNVGEKSEKVYGTVKRDETAPKVTGISPSDSMLGGEPVLQILALDNACLKSVEMDYRRADSDDEWEEIVRVDAAGRECYKEIPWDAKALQEGAAYEVRARAVDQAGNESDYIYRTYTFDLTAPKAPVLNSKSGSFRIELCYSANEEDDFECYKIYRKRYGEKDYTCIQSGTETEYVDKVEDTESVYYYKVRAYDIYGNYSESNIETNHADFMDDIAPEAVLPESMGGMTGEEIAFDGVLSTDNIRISRYEWDFGDGTTAVGARPVHAYAEEGNYTVILTVSDAQGNKSVTTSTAEVVKADDKGSIQLQVTSGYGIGIPGAYVYVKTGDGKSDFKKLRCNSNGYVNIVGTRGTYEVSAFADGFLPQETVVSITPGEKSSRSITLQKGEVVVGEISMHRMSVDEMIERGVDLSSPSNYHTYQFSVELRFAESPLPAYVEYEGTLEEAALIGNYELSGSKTQVALVPPQRQTDEEVTLEIRDTPPAVAYMKTTQTVSWLKDMYLVELGIQNNAASGFSIHDASATLELPRGLSLATTRSGQTLVNQLGDIGGQLQQKTSWIVKGDESGVYEIGARFHGIMSPFEAQMDSRFVSRMEYEVRTGEGLNIYVYPEEAYYPGEKYYVHFEIKNESDRPFYNIKTSIGNFQIPEAVGEVIVKDWKTKEIINYDRWEGEIHITDPDQKALPVVTQGTKLECGVLPPGGSIFGTYCTVLSGNEENYYPYVGSLVEALRGANLGVRVIVKPIPSHIVKCLQFMDPETGTIYGDPVDLTTGAFVQDIQSFHVDQAARLSLGIHYNSLAAEYKGECGYGWTHDYEQHIEDHGSFMDLYLSPYAKVTFISEEADGQVVYGKVEDGKIIIDKEAAYEDVFYPTSQALTGWSLIRTEEGYEVISKDKDIYRFDPEGRITAITAREGKGITIAYGDGKTDIRDEVSGDELHLLYNEEGMIAQIRDDHGRSMTLNYDGEDLTSYTGADGQSVRYVYDGSHRLLYGVDAKGIIYVQNTYDDKDRIVEQKEAGIENAAKYSYEDRDDGGMTVKVCGYNGQTMSVTVNGKGEKIQETDAAGAVTSYTYDHRGNLLVKTDGKGNTESYTYDENNNPVTYTDQNGQTASLSYDGDGNIISRQTGDGSGENFAYDEKGRMIRNISSLGAVTRYAYDDQGNVIRQITDGLGVLSMDYEGGKLTKITDYNGNTTTYGYDAYGNRNAVTDPMGNRTFITYDEAGKILSEITADGSMITYEYDAKGQKIGETVCGKTGGTRTTAYTYDGAGRVMAETTEAGTVSYTYDGEGNITSVTYPDGSRDTLIYDHASHLVKAITAAGITTEYSYDLKGNKIQERTGENRTSYEYDPLGRISKIIQTDGEEIVYTYDERGNCISETMGKGRSYTYTYDAASNLTSETDPLGNRTCYTYDLYGRCIQVTDPKGNSTSYAYDGNGNCIRQTDRAGTVTDFVYDSQNRPIRASVRTDKGNVTTAFAYDEAGRVTAVTDGEGNTIRASYDSFGNLVSLTDAQGRIVESNTYDSLGRLTETADALGSVTAYSYDKAGSVTKMVECLNSDAQAETGFSYDADGKLLAVTDPEGGITSRTYDGSGNITSVKDAMGGTTNYSYDSMNRVTEIVNAIGAVNTYTYNGEGLLSESRNAGGERTSYEYDAAGRITLQKDKAGTIRYTYDENGNILTVSDKNGTITRTYDELDRVTGVTDYKGDTVSYAYDQLGNRISITYPGGEIVRYTYDRAGNLKTATDPWGSVTYYTYDENGRLTETLRGDGSRETREYDAAGHLTALKDVTGSGETISDYSYEYDCRGNIIKITGMDAGLSADMDGTPGTDGTVVNGDGTVTVSITMTYDEDNRLLTYNGQTVEYDPEGNMTRGPLNGGMAEFTYDCRNRLVKVREEDGLITAYEYDAENVRTAVITGGIRTEYTTDRESTCSRTLLRTTYEKNVFGFYTEQKAQTIYTYGAGLVSERRNEENSHGGSNHDGEYYYHYNHLGSTVALSDKNGNIIYRFVYDTYGELSDIQNGDRVSLKTAEETREITKDISIAELADAAGIEYLYNGRYGVSTDRNGLYYMRARYYDQDIKRFINRDVVSGDITNSQSLNRYCYVQGNPVSLTDPFGLCPTAEEIAKIEFRRKLHVALDIIGVFFDGADVLNALLYMAEDDDVNAALSLVFFIPGVGSVAGLPIKYAMKLGGNIGESVLKLGKKFVPELVESGGRFVRNIGGKIDDAGKWISMKVGKTFGQDNHGYKNILNVGAGDTPIPCAINIDIQPNALGVLFGDVNDLSQFASGQFDHVIALNPYKYNLLESDVPRILKKGGIMSITGNYSNRYFKEIYNASSETLRQAGFEIVSKGDAGSIFIKYGGKVTGSTRQTKGIPLQIILRKVSEQ